MGKKVRVGFIGCGRVSENHYRALSRCSNAQLVAVSDTNKELAQLKSKSWGVMELPCDEIYKKKDLDAIFVLTPSSTHFYYVEKALSNGKHVLVEKPVSFDLHEIKVMDDLAKKMGRTCLPGHSYLYLPELHRAKNSIQKGELGQPVLMYFSEIYFMPSELIGKYQGPTKEILWHHIYLMLAYLGIPHRIHAFKTCLRNEEIPTRDEQIMVNAEFDWGALAHLSISWALEDETSDPWTFKLKILGTNGGFHFSRRDLVSNTKNKCLPWGYPLYEEMFEREVDYFVNECITKGNPPLSSLQEAWLTLSVLNAIKGSLESGNAQPVVIEG